MKKGFTLIELLAVIVILAIISLIATPIILSIIEDAREEANKRSIELYASAIKNGIASYQLKIGEEVLPSTYTSSTLPFGVEYDGDVECDVIQIKKDGTIYLGECKVNDEDTEYAYGKAQEKPCYKTADEDGYEMVTCTIGENTESFYVMNSYLRGVPSDKIVMMTKYNIDPTTYRQSDNAGTVVFSSTIYWSSETGPVYDERNDVVKPIVDNYISYLNGSLIEDATGGLLTGAEIGSLGCDSGMSCSSAPLWVYSTTYWLGSSDDNFDVWVMHSSGIFSYGNISSNYGVRPVVTISTSEVK